MKPRSRLRRVLKWAGLGVCVMIVGLWILSLRYYLSCTFVRHIDLHAGYLLVEVFGDLPEPGHRFGLSVGRAIPQAGVGLRWPEVWDEDWSVVLVPLWIPFGIFAVPTAYLFWRDRRPLPGYCLKCGYDLTANISGVCPECGEPVGSPDQAPWIP